MLGIGITRNAVMKEVFDRLKLLTWTYDMTHPRFCQVAIWSLTDASIWSLEGSFEMLYCKSWLTTWMANWQIYPGDKCLLKIGIDRYAHEMVYWDLEKTSDLWAKATTWTIKHWWVIISRQKNLPKAHENLGSYIEKTRVRINVAIWCGSFKCNRRWNRRRWRRATIGEEHVNKIPMANHMIKYMRKFPRMTPLQHNECMGEHIMRRKF